MANRRARGFNLVELSFVIVIILILAGLVAGGGSYLSQQAQLRETIETARGMVAALKGFEAANATTGFPYPQSATTMNLNNDLLPYASGSSVTTYRDAFVSAGSYWTMPVAFPAGGTHAAWINTTYGDLNAHYPGTIVYFYKAGAANGASIQVWNGKAYQSFLYYAVQVLDQRSYPIFTEGH